MAAHREQRPKPRQDLIDRVRREIAQGVYETPEKLEIAVRRMVTEAATRARIRGPRPRRQP
jgi:hypothetical protein